MNPKNVPQPVAWIVFIVVTTGALSLLIRLPRPYSSTAFFVMVVAAGFLALHTFGRSREVIIVNALRRLGSLLLGKVFTPLIQLIRVPILLYQRVRAEVKATSIPFPLRLPQMFSGALSVAVIGGLVLAVVAAFEAPLIGLVIALIVLIAARIAHSLGADVLVAPRLIRRFIAAAFAEDRVELQVMPRLQVAAELLLVLSLSLVATQRFYKAGPDLQLSGGESEWLTNSVYAAHNGLRDYGRIPLWQPLLEFGEPLIDNPFSFVLNPFSSLPSLILGGAQGLKYSVVLTVLLAGVGGWFMGWSLGLAWPGRVLLGLLLIGKGNMSAMFNTGFFQLAVQQAYFPWIAGGAMAIHRLPGRRWPVVLTALSFTLMFFAGNIWYLLPMLVMLALIAVVYLVKPPSQATRQGCLGFWFRINWKFLRGLLLAGLLTVGLSAIALLPLAVNWGQLGKHPPEVQAGWQLDLLRYVAPLYVDPDPLRVLEFLDPTLNVVRVTTVDQLEEFFYSFVLPDWFAILIFVALPFYRPRYTQARRFWLIAWVLLILATMWGAGGKPLFVWLYAQFEFLRGWRFAGRALAVGSFFLAVLVAMRVDSLWHILRETNWRVYFRPGSRIAQILPAVLTLMLLVGSGYAAWQVSLHWTTDDKNILNPIHEDDECVSWLRQQKPTEELSVWSGGYRAITTYMNNRVRSAEIYADFEMSPVPSTLGKLDLTASLPGYGIANIDEERSFLYERGYRVMSDSPTRDPGRNLPCLYHKDDALSYAYTVPLSVVLTAEPGGETAYDSQLASTPLPDDAITLPPDKITPITTFIRQPDNVLLLAQASPDRVTVVTLQERAYPGWEVTVNGQPERLESVGGQIGVILPNSGGQYVVHFAYRPPMLYRGAIITLVCAAFCVAYLLRAERLLRYKNRRDRFWL